MRTDEKLAELCDRLHVNCGDIHEAARWCSVSPAFVFAWIKEDKVAAEKLDEARRVGYAGLESEAIRRAVTGVEEDVWYKGESVGTKIVYSDGLLTKIMEAKLPEYSKKEGGGNTFNGPTQINIMPRAETYEEWLGMRDITLARRDEDGNQPALPAPVEGEYVDVTDEHEKSLEALGRIMCEPPADKPLAALEGLL